MVMIKRNLEILKNNWQPMLDRIEAGWYICDGDNILKLKYFNPTSSIYTFLSIGVSTREVVMDLSSYEKAKDWSIHFLVRYFRDACKYSSGGELEEGEYFEPQEHIPVEDYKDDWVFVKDEIEGYPDCSREMRVYLASESRSIRFLVLDSKDSREITSIELPNHILNFLEGAEIRAELVGSHFSIYFLLELVYTNTYFDITMEEDYEDCE